MTDDSPTITDATAVYTETKKDLDDLDPVANPDDSVPQTEAIDDFSDKIGEMVALGLDEADARSLCGNLTGSCGHTKTEIWNKVERRADHYRSTSDDTPRPFDEVVIDDLVKVTIQSTTDSHHKRSFRWLFAGDGYQVTIETRTSKDDRHSHYDWGHFRDDYFDARDGAEMPAKPRKERRGGEEWKQFLAEIIEDRREIEKVKGTRTIAIEQLQRQIRQTTAYRHLSDALQRDGLGVDSWPEDDVEELWIPNARIKRICDENEITTRALQSELSARSLTSPEINGVSYSAEETTWWRVRREIAEPGAFVEQPESAVDRLAASKQQSAAADGGSTTGEVASVGPDSEVADAGGEADE